MHPSGVVVLVLLFASVYDGLVVAEEDDTAELEEFLETTSASARGLNLGGGFSVHLDRNLEEVNGTNSSTPWDKYALRVDYEGSGFRIARAPQKSAFKIELYANGKEEGRKKHIGQVLIPAIIGFKTTGIFALTFAAATLLVFKALGLAKLAVLVTAGIFLSKYFVKKPYVEVEQFPAYHAQPIILADYPTGYGASEGAPAYVAYTAEDLHQAAESVGQYSVADPELGGESNNSRTSANTAAKRIDYFRNRVSPVPFLTVKKYTVHH